MLVHRPADNALRLDIDKRVDRDAVLDNVFSRVALAARVVALGRHDGDVVVLLPAPALAHFKGIVGAVAANRHARFGNALGPGRARGNFALAGPEALAEGRPH